MRPGHRVFLVTPNRPPRTQSGCEGAAAFTRQTVSIYLDVEYLGIEISSALLISEDAPWLTTEQFLDALDVNLQKEMASR